MNLAMTESPEELDKIRKALETLRKTKLTVGLPEGAPERSRWLLALHERGAPAMNIPPRPVVAPALSQASVKEAMAEALSSACRAAAEGDEAGVRQGFEKAGEAGVQGIRDYIDDGIKPGNAQVTISGGWVYNRIAKKSVHVSGKGFDKPLYETGALYNSFGYEVKNDG